MIGVDKLSKMAHFIATMTAKEISRVFIDFVYKHHGLPWKLVSDRDKRFTNWFWVALCNVLGTQTSYVYIFSSSNRWADKET